MDEQTDRLIRRYDLAAEVADFVRRRAGDLAREPRRFSFAGSCRRCADPAPHHPHAAGGYDTVRYGHLQYFCPGQSGGGLEVVVERQVRGSAESPSRLSGYCVEGPRRDELIEAGVLPMPGGD